MQSAKDLKLAEKSLVLQQEVITELNAVVRDSYPGLWQAARQGHRAWGSVPA